MTRIGPHYLSKAPIKPPPPPLASSRTQGSGGVESGSANKAPQDLVTITGGSTSSGLRQGAKNAGAFFFKKALPTVAGAVAGPIGIAAGALVTGTLEYLDRPEQKTSVRLKAGVKTALKTAAVAGVLGIPGLLFAPLAPILQSTAATVGTGAAFGLELSNKNQPDFEVNLSKLSKIYQKQAQQKLSEAGHKNALKNLTSGFGLTKRSRDLKAQMRLTQITAVTSHYLGAGASVALLHEIGRQGVDSDKMTGLMGDPYADKKTSEQIVDGVEVQRVDGLMKTERTWGSALYGKVFVDSELVLDGTDAKADFVAGHELSHIKNKDSSATLIQKTVEKAIDKSLSLTSSASERQHLVELQNDFSKAELAISRDMEFRADADGMEHALNLGHSANQVKKAASEIFGAGSSDDTYSHHPSATRRLDALNKESGTLNS